MLPKLAALLAHVFDVQERAAKLRKELCIQKEKLQRCKEMVS